MKKNSTITINDLANMITDLAEMQKKTYEVLDQRISALEKSTAKSAKVAKPVAEKSKTSSTTTTTTTAPKWVLDKKCVYSAPNAWVSKNARYAFKMQATEAGGEALSDTEREALVKKLGDKYVSVRKFKTEKAAKEFFKKWMEQ